MGEGDEGYWRSKKSEERSCILYMASTFGEPRRFGAYESLAIPSRLAVTFVSRLEHVESGANSPLAINTTTPKCGGEGRIVSCPRREEDIGR